MNKRFVKCVNCVYARKVTFIRQTALECRLEPMRVGQGHIRFGYWPEIQNNTTDGCFSGVNVETREVL